MAAVLSARGPVRLTEEEEEEKEIAAQAAAYWERQLRGRRSK